MDDEPAPHVEPAPGIDAQLCAKCKQIKPLRAFRRTLTAAQAAARGYYNHHVRPMTVPSKFCNDCRPGKMTPSGLRHMPYNRLVDELENNRVRRGLVMVEVQRRARTQPVSRQEMGRRGAAARWEQYHADRWRYAKGRIKKELARLTAQSYYYSRKLASDSAEYFGAHYEAVLAFNAACARSLRELRAQATGFVLRRTVSEDGLTWAQWMGATQYHGLRELWDAIPEPSEEAMRAVFGKRTRRPTFRSRLPLPMVLDASNEQQVFYRCPVKTRYKDEVAEADRTKQVIKAAQQRRGDDDGV